MPVNHYFQDGRMVGESSEQNLIEDLILESISIYGVDLFYLPKTNVNIDELFLESTIAEFKKAIPIEAYLESVNGFGGNDLLTKFGIQMNDSGTFVISRRRWEQLVGRSGAELQLPNRPAEGDIVFFPKTQSYFEIKKVDVFNPYYQLGKLYVYKLEVELLNFSSEKFQTGLADIDDTGPTYLTMDMYEYQLLLEDGTPMLLEDAEESAYFILEDWSVETTDPTADNSTIKTLAPSVVEWSGNNPFGENNL